MRALDTIEALLERTHKTLSGCMVWKGQLTAVGGGGRRLPYGVIGSNKAGRRLEGMAHKRAWVAANGPVPDGMKVMHKCGNPPCINPAHLELGTQKDVALKARLRRGQENPSTRLTEQDVLWMRQLHDSGTPKRDLAAMFGITRMNVSQIVRGVRWGHLKQCMTKPKETKVQG